MLVWTVLMDTASRGMWKNGEKWINFIFCLGTAYDISSMESVGKSNRFLWWGKYALKMFLSLNFRFELWHLYKSLIPSAKGLSFILCNFYFEFESPCSPTRRQYDRTWVLGVANMWVCFMNGSMVEHDGLGIACFSVDILKDMVACWYAGVSKLLCQN